MAMKIMLDAGHYGKYNRSPAVKEYYESEMNWKLHLMLKKYLEEYGFEVGTTREDQKKDLEVSARGRLGKGYDLLLSIHSNSTGNSQVNEKIDHPSIYVQLSGRGDKLGKLLADCVASVMETREAGSVSSREGNRGDYYGVLRGAESVDTTALIIEHSFHTNTRSTKWLMDDGNLDRMARAEAKLLADYFAEESGEKMVFVSLPQLSRGSKRSEVRTLQMLLSDLDYRDQNGEALEIDGSFGGKTDHAARAFQREQGLDPDGYIGEKSWAALLKGG